MNTTSKLALAALLLAPSCRTTVDTSTTLMQVVDTRHAAEIHVRDDGDRRCMIRIGQDVYVGDPLGDEWIVVPYTEFGALPALEYEEDGVLVMTGDVVVGGTRVEPVVLQVSRLWRAGFDDRDELLFETKDVILGSFASLGPGYLLAISFDGDAPESRRYGSAVLRLEDEEYASVTLSDFDAATLLRIDPVDEVPVVFGERRAGDGTEWGLFRLQGVERRPALWEARVVSPAFSEDGEALAYAWKPDREAARSGRGTHDGPFERVTWIDRDTGSGNHLDLDVDVVATCFDPRERELLYVLGRRDVGEWEWIVLERESSGLRVLRRGAFPAWQGRGGLAKATS